MGYPNSWYIRKNIKINDFGVSRFQEIFISWNWDPCAYSIWISIDSIYSGPYMDSIFGAAVDDHHHFLPRSTPSSLQVNANVWALESLEFWVANARWPPKTVSERWAQNTLQTQLGGTKTYRYTIRYMYICKFKHENVHVWSKYSSGIMALQKNMHMYMYMYLAVKNVNIYIYIHIHM